jgi:hypothetical protein
MPLSLRPIGLALDTTVIERADPVAVDIEIG